MGKGGVDTGARSYVLLRPPAPSTLEGAGRGENGPNCARALHRNAHGPAPGAGGSARVQILGRPRLIGGLGTSLVHRKFIPVCLSSNGTGVLPSSGWEETDVGASSSWNRRSTYRSNLDCHTSGVDTPFSTDQQLKRGTKECHHGSAESSGRKAR